MSQRFYEHLAQELESIEEQGLFKSEQEITSPQSGTVDLGSRKVVNLCANNYLGLADNEEVYPAMRVDSKVPRYYITTHHRTADMVQAAAGAVGITPGMYWGMAQRMAKRRGKTKGPSSRQMRVSSCSSPLGCSSRRSGVAST